MKSFDLLLVLVIFSSCSVKENRAECPCRLLVFADAMAPDDVSAFVYDVPKKIDEQIINPEEKALECVVPRKELRVTYAKYPWHMSRDNEMYKIPFGNECDSLFAYSHVIDCSTELVVDTVKLRKNFASLYGKFVSGSGFGYVVVSGNVCGVSIVDLHLIDGAFRFEPSVDARGCFLMRLPRQKDASLFMEIYDADGSFLWTYPLGQEIVELGYDWSAPNLSDISLEIESSHLEIMLKIVPWDDAGPSDVTI